MPFSSPGGTPCIQMSCKQDIESIASEAENGDEGRWGLVGEIKTNAKDIRKAGVTERETSDATEERYGSCKGEGDDDKKKIVEIKIAD